jgi:hypothetical protein
VRFTSSMACSRLSSEISVSKRVTEGEISEERYKEITGEDYDG